MWRPGVLALAACLCLGGVGLGAAVRSPKPAADATDLAVCRRLAAGAAGTPREKLTVDVDGNGRPEHLEIALEGMDAPVAMPGIRRGTEETPDELGWTVEDNIWLPLIDEIGARWMAANGRVYLLRYARHEPTYLKYAARLGHDLRLTPVCRFAPVTEVTFPPARPADAAFCRAVAQDRAPVVPPSNPPPISPQHPLNTLERQEELSVRVDFDNSGRPADLVLVALLSDHGLGCEKRYYETIDPTVGGRRTGLLDLDPDPIHGGRSRCADGEPRWLRWQGKTYLETRSLRPRRPLAEDEEYWFVRTIENDAARDVCRARYTRRPPKLTGFWKGGWIGLKPD